MNEIGTSLLPLKLFMKFIYEYHVLLNAIKVFLRENFFLLESIEALISSKRYLLMKKVSLYKKKTVLITDLLVEWLVNYPSN